MKLLLTAINAKYIHSNLAVYSLKSYVSRNDVEIQIAEYTINNYTEDILKEIYKQKADIVVFSCYIWNIDIVLEVLRELKKVSPHTKIWVGGPEVSYDAPEVLKANDEIDLVMIGEGEETFKELLDACMEDKSFSDVAGIAYKKGESIVKTKGRPQISMDILPFVYKDLKGFENKIIYYETQRGCPFSCSYCLSSIDKGVRFRSVDLVCKELQFFIDQCVKQVKFVDRTFNCNRRHSTTIWTYLMEHDNGITNFHFEISADLLTEEDLALFALMRPGLIQLEVGVQSTYGQTIEEIDRTMDFDCVSKKVQGVNALLNIHQHLDLIVGLPYEDLDTFRRSFNDVHALRPNQLQLGFLKVLKGSKMHEKKDEYGILYRSHAPYEVLETKWISYDQVLLLKSVEEMVEVYYNSSQFVYSMEYLLHFFKEPFECYYALAQYYEKQGLTGIKHTRLARYEILRKFAMEQYHVDVLALEDLLLYDLYLRENIKSRPSWAKDTGRYKRIYNEFFQSKELSMIYFEEGKYDSKTGVKVTHIEPFVVDILQTSRLGKTIYKRQHVMFDYSRRNPLTYEAMALWIKELKHDEECG